MDQANGAGPWAHAASAAPPPAAGPRVKATDFLAAQRENRLKTVNLILILLILGFTLGYALGLGFDAYAQPGHDVFGDFLASRSGFFGGSLLLGIGLIASGVALTAGDKVVLSLNNAREVSPEEEPRLHNVVEEMAIAAGLPKPRVAVIETDALNAFATGMRSEKAAIGVTRGLLEKLDRDELQGVIGHEMGHILNLDIRYMTAVGILVGLIALVSDAVLRAHWRPSGSSGKKAKGGGAIILIIVLFVVVLSPIAARLVQFAVSRQREYLADATSVQLTRNPLGLIGALGKLANQNPVRELGNRATQHLFIVNPIREFGANASALIATHPAIEDRIKRLENLGKV
jgi:heat shock protein HtpX